MAESGYATAAEYPRGGDRCVKEYTGQLLDKAAEAIEAAELLATNTILTLQRGAHITLCFM